MAKKKAKESIELAQRKAHRAHMLLVLSEKRKRENVEKPIEKRSHSSENISRSVEQKTKRPKTTHRGEKLEYSILMRRPLSQSMVEKARNICVFKKINFLEEQKSDVTSLKNSMSMYICK